MDQTLIPTRLLAPSERPAVSIVAVVPPHRFPALRTYYRFLRWAIEALWLRSKGSVGRTEYARRLCVVFEDLGGLWVKVGQLMSLRIDSFPAELCQELSTLQDRANGFPFEIARRLVEDSLGGPLTQYFDEFEELPFAAASIGQVHRAHLRHDDVWVAVKVQRPYLARTVANELALIGRITRFMDAFSIWSYVRWREFHWELQHILEEEIDYRFEAENLRRMRKTLRRHKIYVPKVFDRYSSRYLLVMEFVSGALMSDYIQLSKRDPERLKSWLVENNIDPQLMARRLCLSLLRQVLEDNLFHGDLHPGNIILLRDSRVALIDFGAAGFVEREYLEKFNLFTRSLATRDYDKAADLAFLLSASLPVRDLEPAKEDVVRALRAWGARTFVKELPYHEKSVDSAWLELGKIYFRYKCTFSWELLRIRRASSTLDASVMHLYPDANYTQLVKQHFRRAQRRALKKFGNLKSLRQRLTNITVAAGTLPEKAAETLFFTAATVRKQAKVLEGETTKLANLFAVLFGNLVVVSAALGIFVVLVLLDRHAPTVVAPIMKRFVDRAVRAAPSFHTDTWLVLLAIDAYLYWTFAKLRRRFRRKEVRAGPSTYVN
jgi:ubiquinone biosynthesis protein